MTGRLGWKRTIAFGSGDFAFNLYWQSLTLYLLFYYTEAVGLSAASAGLIYMVASIWDGIVDPLIGAAADRTRTRWGRYRPWLLLGAVPLALGFGLLYWPAPLQGGALVAAAMAAHLLFRSLYAAVNVPYIALTARITRSSADRANIAGARLVFSTIAGVIVALVTPRVATWVTGSADGAQGYFVAAAIFAFLATPILFFVFSTTREDEGAAAPADDVPLLGNWRILFANRAFWTLVMASALFIACYTAFAKSILYYFKYVLDAPDAGPTALALGGVTGLAIIPAWMFAARRIAKRTIWLMSCVIFGSGLVALGVFRFDSVGQMNLFVVFMQLGFQGIVFAYWGMLPDTVEYGEWKNGLRREGSLFGVALLFQKVALGLGAGLFGVALDSVGFAANQHQSAATIDGMRAIMVLIPLFGVLASAALMALNPLRRGVHERIVAEIAGRSTGEIAK
ncbi:glycoside-pentoside-hexuronide (GPH):cation symporter [Sphingopyxis sp. CCNWLW253]|uniref:MFS transporter n=1 Tax=unclassified Sphingopyxis TaxID=2614943 RepID=UPI003012F00D